MKISVIGFGYIGAVISAVYSSMGHKVCAIDNNHSCIKELNLGICNIPEPKLQKIISDQVKLGNLKGSCDYENVKDSDAILITVGTPLSDKFDADLTAIRNVFMQLSQNIKKDQLIMLKSTVLPGITRQMFDEFLQSREDIYLGFSPERLAEGNAIEELKNLPIIVGGVNNKSTKRCSYFWKNTLGVEVIEMASAETAELVKLANNQWIDTNIALANEMAMLCDSLPFKLDVLEIIKAANTLKKGQHNVNILQPSIGVGGYCLTKDPWFVASLAEKNGIALKLPKTGREINDSMPLNAANAIIEIFKANKTNLKSAKISILGYSFKSNSGDVRFSPMEAFVDEMFKKGISDISVFDSTLCDGSIKDGRIKRLQTWQQAVSCANCVVFGTAHDDIKTIDLTELSELMHGEKIVYDGRRYFSKFEIKELLSLGIYYLGVGRSV